MASLLDIAAALWNILWNWILIPRYGIEGAALATLSSFVLLAILLQAMMRSTSGIRARLTGLLHPLMLSVVFPLIALALGGRGHIVRIIVIFTAGPALYIMFGIHTRLVRAADIARARETLEPRGDVPHVRLALSLLAALEAVRRRLAREE